MFRYVVFLAGAVVLGVGGYLLAARFLFDKPPRHHDDPPDAEVRDFTISVDGKPAGEYHLAISPGSDGTLSVTEHADVRVRKLGILVYSYSFDGSEQWQGQRLLSLKSTALDNGKKFQVDAAAEGDDLRVRVNGDERRMPRDVWTTSYWRLPARAARKHALVLIDNDTGNEIDGRLEFLKSESMVIAGRLQSCEHYRLSGGPSPVDLWYDARERLVRQQYDEDGHRTLLELRGR